MYSTASLYHKKEIKGSVLDLVDKMKRLNLPCVSRHLVCMVRGSLSGSPGGVAIIRIEQSHIQYEAMKWKVMQDQLLTSYPSK